MKKDWRESDKDDNPFGLNEQQKEGVEGYLNNNFYENGKRKHKPTKNVGNACNQPERECERGFDKDHNFCVNICGVRVRCKRKSLGVE